MESALLISDSIWDTGCVFKLCQHQDDEQGEQQITIGGIDA